MLKSITSDLRVYAKELTVLIAEDEVDLAQELRDILSMFFKKVYLAYDGLEALDIYKTNRCDLVITDLNMPKLDGVGLAKEIRILDKDQTIFVASGHIDQFVVELIDIGIQALIMKPFKINQFFQKLLVHCENIHFKNEIDSFKQFDYNQYNAPVKTEQKIISLKKETESTKAINTLTDNDSNSSVYKFIENFNINREFDEDFWNHIKDDILETNHDFEDCINRISLNGIDYDIKSELVRIFSKYYNSLLLIPELNQISMVFKNMENTFSELDMGIIDNSSFNEVFKILEYFYEDIMNFFNVVFIDKNTRDVNYLTDSLDSSLIQLKTKLGLVELEEEELELF